ncbi:MULTISPECIES: hypothetical protein [Methanothrix]|jgi:hypothetical protein|uniref:hypothetical protein n=1 Tax=Methanothrix TaxID=2222 RepID=UPI00064EBB94|nr:MULTISPECIES: hypothetical protein [Methanothrix]OPX83105.1 MAG: hypothetical protein A4E43_00256 [Methanosaeta sp. PtaB.Bin005]MDD5256514.1 hypothetical protein [Methanothrix soehngenii]HNY34428.1 hypothetical protein [Methanothrix soehngenii]HOE46492.1 hypothetical protein [Methanothrix soehngenii]HOS23332.1 hypothetical protein [Methanothrix soehngenii]
MSAVHGIVDVDLDLQHCVAVKAAGDEGLAYTLVFICQPSSCQRKRSSAYTPIHRLRLERWFSRPTRDLGISIFSAKYSKLSGSS